MEALCADTLNTWTAISMYILWQSIAAQIYTEPINTARFVSLDIKVGHECQ